MRALKVSYSDVGEGGVAVNCENTQFFLNNLYMMSLELFAGRNWVRGGRRFICNRKDEIIHGLSPGVKCVAPLFRDVY